jgi:hypothetical protein
MHLKNVCFLIVSVAGLAFSCDDEPTESKKKQMIGSWERTSSMMTVPSGTYNVFNDLESCQQDNITSFNADGSYDVEEGETKCSEDDPQIITGGVWVVAGDSLALTATGQAPWKARIEAINQTTLTLSYEETIASQVKRYRDTYQRK